MPFPSCLAGFWGFHPYMCFGKLFMTCSCCYFLEIVREKWGRQEDAWSVNYESIELCCSQTTKNHSNASKCEVVNLSTRFRTQVQSTLVLWGFAHRLIYPIDPNTVVSFLSCSAHFWVFHPYMRLSSLENFFVTCSCCFFFEIEKRGG